MSLVSAPWVHLGFASLHVLLGHFGQAAVFRARFRRSPMALYRRGETPHRATSRAVALASLLWAAALIATATSPAFRACAWGAALATPRAALGWAVAGAGMALMLVAQAAMGEHFRIGQHPDDAPDTLRTTGLLAWSRNPIYLGSWSCLVGMSLWHPNVSLLLSCALVGVGMHGLVLAEERFLAARFGDTFQRWKERVPRYIGVRR